MKHSNASHEDQLKNFKARHNLKELNTSKEAAEALRVSDFTLRLSRSTGKLLGIKAPKHINYGRAVRYQASDLMAWIETDDKDSTEAA